MLVHSDATMSSLRGLRGVDRACFKVSGLELGSCVGIWLIDLARSAGFSACRKPSAAGALDWLHLLLNLGS